MENYEDIRSLGRGAFAAVRLVRRVKDGQLFVIKKFHTALSELNQKERLEVVQEVKLLAHLTHKNIVRFHDSFNEDGVMHIVMEYATGGTLHTKITERNGELFDEDTIWEWFVQIVLALHYVHSCNILHRDLKTQNIMLSGAQQRTIKLGDFGIAKVLGSHADMAATIVGTPNYLSPELCQGQSYDKKSDIWALGCVLYELAALVKPFDASNMPAIIFRIMKSQPAPLPPGYSDDLKEMVAQLLKPLPSDRPSVDDILSMPIVELHLRRWRATSRRLRGPLPTPDGGGGKSTPDDGSMREDTDDRVPKPASFLTPPTPSSAQQQKKDSAELEEYATEELGELRSLAENAGVENQVVTNRLNALQSKLEQGAAVSGKVWEELGRVWSDVARFDEAIQAYRTAIRAKNSNTSLGAMEQLGNMLVRRAQQVWSLARAGKIAEAEAAAKVVDSKPTPMRQAMQTGAVQGQNAAGAPAQPEWAKVASALMLEGLGLLERLCVLGPTGERRCLLGSAYKRCAWMGLGSSRKEYLQNAAASYGEAHELEIADNPTMPSPYARLNQLTLELLASAGDPQELETLRENARQAEAWANARTETDPKDVWLWVQAMDAKCLRYLLRDEMSRKEVVGGYRQQLGFAASERVKSSVMDQFSFLQEVLNGRVAEESEWMSMNTKGGGSGGGTDQAATSGGAGGGAEAPKLFPSSSSISPAVAQRLAAEQNLGASPTTPRHGAAVFRWLSRVLQAVIRLKTALNGEHVSDSEGEEETGKGKGKGKDSEGTKGGTGGGSAGTTTSSIPTSHVQPAQSASVASAEPSSNPFALNSTSPYRRRRRKQQGGTGGEGGGGGGEATAAAAEAKPAGANPNPFAADAQQPYRRRRRTPGSKAAGTAGTVPVSVDTSPTVVATGVMEDTDMGGTSTDNSSPSHVVTPRGPPAGGTSPLLAPPTPTSRYPAAPREVGSAVPSAPTAPLSRTSSAQAPAGDVVVREKSVPTKVCLIL